MSTPTTLEISRLLVVDDEPGVGALFRTVLGLDHPDVDVRWVESATMALELVGEWLPQAVVVDAVMPDQNGVDLVRQLRARHPGIRLIMFSSLPYGEVAEDAATAGADGFVEKSAGHLAVLDLLDLPIDLR